MNNIVSVLMGTGNKVYLNYGVAEGQNLKLIRMAFILCSTHFDNTILLRLLLLLLPLLLLPLLLLLIIIIVIKYHDERF